MNRRIIFRGKDLNTNEWVFGNLIIGLEHDYYILVYSNEGFAKYIVDPDTVGQFTGLKDKNGKEVFEGDIVEVTCLRISQYGRKMLCLIVYDEELACFSFKASDRIRCMSATIPDADIEVINNRFDNPELLNE